MILGKYKAVPVRVGLRVGAVSGPGEFPEHRAGIVIEKVLNRWGTHWIVQMDRGTIESISCPVTNEMGIGWYAVGEGT
jgi:hypothetical protein